MFYTLKDYQAAAVTAIGSRLRTARSMRTSVPPTPSATALEAATGAGKTVIAAALIEAMFFGDPESGIEPDPSAVILWFSDSPTLNEQSRRRIREASSELEGRLVTIESTFKGDSLEPGNVYFLNAQKLAASSNLVRGERQMRDENRLDVDDFRSRPRPDMAQGNIYDTLRAIIEDPSKTLYLILDEAHRGMGERIAGRQTIVRRLISGDPSIGLPAMPIVLGISATPGRFTKAMEAIKETRPLLSPYAIPVDKIRASGLLKDDLRLYVSAEQSEDTLLGVAIEAIRDATRRWRAYATSQGDPRPVRPLLVIQFEDKASPARIEEALARVVREWEGIEPRNIRHAFGEHEPIVLPGAAIDTQETSDGQGHSLFPGLGMTIHYISPEDVQLEESVRVLIAKTAISTGWDCPRAEVLLSFRRSVDETVVTQTMGRMVRTPLARRIETDDVLNGATCILPYFDEGVATTVAKRVITGTEDPIPDDPEPTWGDPEWNGGALNDVPVAPPGHAPHLVPSPPSSTTAHSGDDTASAVKADGEKQDLTGTASSPDTAPDPTALASGEQKTAAPASGELRGIIMRPDSPLECRPLPPTSAARGDRRIITHSHDLAQNPALSEAVWGLFDRLPTYSIPRGGSKPIPRLLEVAILLSTDRLVPGAVKEAHRRLHAVLDGRRVQYRDEIASALEDVRTLAVTEITATREGTTSTRVISTAAGQDVLDRAYLTAGRVLGAELARTYSEHLAGPDGDDDALEDAHEIVAAMAHVPEIIADVEEAATDLATSWLVSTRVARMDLGESRQAEYDRLTGQAERPVLMQIVRPTSVTVQTSYTLGNSEFVLPVAIGHLLADEQGYYPLDLNSWETEVLGIEGQRTLVGWYRNPSKATKTAVAIPYRDASGAWTAVRPDFIFFRQTATGTVVADIVDPHGFHLADALPKLKALANFAETDDARALGRIDSVAKMGNSWKVLDLRKAETREAVRSAQDAKTLFASGTAQDYR